MKIKFISNSPFNTYKDGVTINPSFLYLKTYYDMYGQNTVTWLPWEAVLMRSEEQQLASILEEKPDILAFAMFIWNDKLHFSIAKKVKELLPDTVILMGGPQLNAHKNTDFFQQHPYVDWVCYGDGERAFQLLVDKLQGNNDLALVNMVENVEGTAKVYPYELFDDAEYWATSPYLTNKDIVESCNDTIEAAGYDRKGIRWAVEFARGCPYKCSFCDWSQNLTKKVKRRKHDWRADLHYFFEQDIQLVETDANFGQYKEDLEIFDYAMDLHKNNPGTNFRLGIVNTSKLNKEATYHIMLNQTLHFDWFPVILSLQDINDDILANIDRPGISYQENIELVKRFKDNLPASKHHLVAWVHLIIGLPGQSYRRVCDMSKRLIQDGINGGMLELQFWSYLENAPAADPEYQKKYDLKWMDLYSIASANTSMKRSELLEQCSDLEQIYQRIAQEQYNKAFTYSFKCIYKNSTMDFEEIMASKMLQKNLRRYQKSNGLLTDLQGAEFEQAFTGIENETRAEAEEYIRQNQPLIDRYGFAVLVFVNQQGKFETIGI